MGYIAKDRKNERGVTMVLVAIALVSVLAMAALAVDVLALYVARGEAQRAADAGALAAAKMFAFTGYTSNQTASAITQAQLCVSGPAGSTAAANEAAETVISQNTVAGQAPTLQNINCDFSQPENPRVQVKVQRAGLPVLFGRIWSAAANSVSATASAEAFNPSGGTSTIPIAVASVKPWLIPNCPDTACAAGGKYFTSTYGIANSGAFIGTSQTFTRMDPTDNTNPLPGGAPYNVPPNWWFYALDPPQPNDCPSSGALNCNQIGTGPPGVFYHDNIACSNTAFQFSCGQQIASSQAVVFDQRPLGFVYNRTIAGISCMIHASGAGTGLGMGQDQISLGVPTIITGGTNNPNPSLQNVVNISRSDSVVTVPVYTGGNPCLTGASSCNTTVIGFLQLGIQDVQPGGQFDAVVMNASSCNPSMTGTPISGGALAPSSIPVRLIHQ